MIWFYRHLVRPVLFAQNPEDIHRFTLEMLGWASRHELMTSALESILGAPELPTRVLGLAFPNPVGLAAGMDKAGEAVPAWAAMGFGHAELGAVTWQGQPGNPLPRLFRAIPDEAIVNRMGFNNAGALEVAESLAKWRREGRWPRHPVGLNLGKTKVTPLAKAPEDYAQSLAVLWPHADFFVVNVSSPNTPNLRQLQDKAALDEILVALQETNQLAARSAEAPLAPARPPGENRHPEPKPILVKIAPDLEFAAIDDILSLVEPRRLAGIVATNTTLQRPATTDAELARIYAESGGLSGRPLRARSTEVIRYLYRRSQGKLPIIGVGGIFSANDAWEKIAAGAALVQIYTSLVYEGPWVVKRIVTGLLRRMSEAGFHQLSEAVGCENRP